MMKTIPIRSNQEPHVKKLALVNGTVVGAYSLH